MAENPPQHPTLTPEEAGRLIKQNGESELLTAEEIASSLRDHVEEFGPNEAEIGGTLYTVWIDDDEEEKQMTHEHEPPEAPTLAHTIIEAVADLHPGGVERHAYLQRFLDELLELEPGLRSYLLDLLLDQLKEEIIEREDSTHSHASIELITSIARDWGNQQ